MSVSKSHFNAVAEVFKRASALSLLNDLSCTCGLAESMRLHLATHLARVFEQENAKFDTTRFLQACGAPME